MAHTAARTSSTILPPEDLEPLLDLSRFLEHVSAPSVLVGPDGQTVGLPQEVYEVLIKVVDAMSHGRAITVAPVDQMLTTQEAANHLGISRPTLVKLLETGRIPFERPAAGRHRRVRLEDLVEYQKASAQERSDTLDEMTREAVEAGMYEDTTEDYTAILRHLRTSSGS